VSPEAGDALKAASETPTTHEFVPIFNAASHRLAARPCVPVWIALYDAKNNLGTVMKY
jgi:hypothetical protein